MELFDGFSCVYTPDDHDTCCTDFQNLLEETLMMNGMLVVLVNLCWGPADSLAVLHVM
jgi:hypothetical protein